MRKSEQIGLRVSVDLKRSLTQIAKAENRSVAQICEMLLKSGVLSYKEEGPKYFLRLLTKQKVDTED